MRFYIRKTSNGEYYFSVVATNGETLAHSENYTRKASAEHAVNVIRREAGGSSVIDQA